MTARCRLHGLVIRLGQVDDLPEVGAALLPMRSPGRQAGPAPLVEQVHAARRVILRQVIQRRQAQVERLDGRLERKTPPGQMAGRHRVVDTFRFTLGIEGPCEVVCQLWRGQLHGGFTFEGVTYETVVQRAAADAQICVEHLPHEVVPESEAPRAGLIDELRTGALLHDLEELGNRAPRYVREDVEPELGSHDRGDGQHGLRRPPERRRPSRNQVGDRQQLIGHAVGAQHLPQQKRIAACQSMERLPVLAPPEGEFRRLVRIETGQRNAPHVRRQSERSEGSVERAVRFHIGIAIGHHDQRSQRAPRRMSSFSRWTLEASAHCMSSSTRSSGAASAAEARSAVMACS